MSTTSSIGWRTASTANWRCMKARSSMASRAASETAVLSALLGNDGLPAARDDRARASGQAAGGTAAVPGPETFGRLERGVLIVLGGHRHRKRAGGAPLLQQARPPPRRWPRGVR